MLYSSTRRFQFWDYTVSHQQLLLRSPLSSDQATNIDIVFLGVDFLQIPSAFEGLQLSQATVQETAKVAESLNCIDSSCRVFSLRSQNRHYYVAAAAFIIYENQLELFESSLEYFSIHEESPEPGKVLIHS